MHAELEKFFEGQRARRVVAEAMLRYGLRVDNDGRIYCKNIEMAPAKIARALDVDRRVVIDTAQEIAENDFLFDIFHSLEPRSNISNSAKALGFDVIEIHADPKRIGIVSAVTQILAKHKMSIRQMIADDADLFPEPILTIIVNGKLNGKMIEEIRKLKHAEKIILK
ncbi:amino acid-binding ACT domain protein [Candidatus Micrarchaeota archaeon]|nr:MAG: amino acid-binding ACT domain protein [Candidatus Micrarchaeota archaeon]